jgi:predicted nucleic acid-binding protein
VLLKQVKIITSVPAANLFLEHKDLPAKDRPILIAAIASKATHLITGDYTHFKTLFGKTIQGVLILPPAAYLKDKDRS